MQPAIHIQTATCNEPAIGIKSVPACSLQFANSLQAAICKHPIIHPHPEIYIQPAICNHPVIHSQPEICNQPAFCMLPEICNQLTPASAILNHSKICIQPVTPIQPEICL